MTIRRRLILLNLLLALLVFLVGFFAFRATSRVENHFKVLVNQSVPTALAVRDIRASSLALAASANDLYIGVLEAKPPSALAPNLAQAEQAIAELEEHSAHYQTLVEAYFPDEQAEMQEIVATATAMRQDGSAMLALIEAMAPNGEIDERREALEEGEYALIALLDVVDEREASELTERAERVQGASDEGVREGLVVVVTALVLAILMGTWASSIIARPIQHLVEATQRMSQGDLAVTLPPAGTDEVGQLSNSFGTMAERLRELVGTLEERVEARTADLHSTVEELEVARQEAEDANRAKSTFLANMSHELRTPLTIIIGYSELMLEVAEEAQDQESTDRLQRVHNAARHLLSMVNDILDFSKIEAGRLDIQPRHFELSELLGETLAALQPLLERNQNTLHSTPPPHLGSMYGDPTRLRQILFNLLSNASKFTERGSVRLEVVRAERPGGDWLFFVVQDTGMGMDAEQLDNLFQPFMQVQNGRERREGTGLGLVISRRLAQMMGGDISVQSMAGVGSTFTVRLPATYQRPGIELPKSSTPAPAATAAMGQAGLPILVIDDDEPTRNLLATFLRREGYEVLTATGGDEGLQIARSVPLSAVTLDVVMPERDGWSVLASLKAEPLLAHLPVCLVSISEDQRLGMALGAADYLVKPVSQEQLATALGRALHQPRPSAPDVLLVDDDPQVRALIGAMLRSDGWDVREAGNGREALQHLQQSQPLLILLDLMMPEVDGFRFVQQFQGVAAWQGIPIVVLTAIDVTSEQRSVLNGQVVETLQKAGLSRERLLGHVRRWAAERTRPLAPSADGP